jgi:predicted RNase H-like HicB family nuclease
MRDNMNLTFETELEDDGRWIAEVPELPGCMAYGATETEAVGKAEALALRVLAERIEHGESTPMDVRITIAAE